MRANPDKRSAVAEETGITSSITTVVYMLGYMSGFISCIVSSSVLGLSATFTISHLAFYFVADTDHRECRLGTHNTYDGQKVAPGFPYFFQIFQSSDYTSECGSRMYIERLHDWTILSHRAIAN